ncbi:MAG TPA: nucleotidyltransferase family protein [Gaiellaceae bacterium]
MRPPDAPHARAARLALSFRADRAATELFAQLRARELDAILLRGPAIARRLYADGDRAYGDCDILVDETRRGEIEQVIAELDFVSYTPLASAQHWHRDRDGVEIDLHRALNGAHVANPVLWSAFSAHRTPFDLDGTPITTLDEAGTAVVVALHAAQHGALVPHTLHDLERALVVWDVELWRRAAALAEEIGGLVAFRQALTMIPSGEERLAALGLHPAVSMRSTLRRRGVSVPLYLTEALTPLERLTIVLRRVAPSRAELAKTFDPRAANSTPRLLAVHAHRLGRLPLHAARLLVRSRRARAEALAIRRQHAG